MRKFYTAAALALACAAVLALNAACKSGDRAGAERASSASTPASSATQTTSTPQQAADSATPHPTSTPGDGVRRVTVADARQAADRGEAVIVDVRPKAQYDQGHIKGSLSVPKNELTSRLAELPKDKLIIFYCA